MLYSKLGNTGLIVSRLSLGTMTFNNGAGLAAIGRTERAEADTIVGRAIEAGVNFLDTADIYSSGESETILGQVIKGRRDELVIATKAGWRSGEALGRSGLSAGHLHWSIDQSLQRLGTDHVDLYIAHRSDVNTPLEETLVVLDAIVRSGKARYLGVSNWPAWQVAAAVEFQRANGLAQFTHVQMMYHLLGRGIEVEVIPMMARYGLGLTAWSPLAGGFLSGKYTRENLNDADNRLAGFDFIPFDKEQGFALVETMRAMAERHRATVAQVAVAWLLARPEVSSVILGASKMSQLDDNLGAVDVALSAEDVALLDAATATAPSYPGWMADRNDEDIAKALAATPKGRQ
ncbi:MAG: aldo/keto reductase [Sphingomicrobium sp.]